MHLCLTVECIAVRSPDHGTSASPSGVRRLAQLGCGPLCPRVQDPGTHPPTPPWTHPPTTPRPLQRSGQIFFRPSADPKIFQPPSALISLDQKFSSAPLAPLKTQHHLGQGTGGRIQPPNPPLDRLPPPPRKRSPGHERPPSPAASATPSLVLQRGPCLTRQAAPCPPPPPRKAPRDPG